MLSNVVMVTLFMDKENKISRDWLINSSKHSFYEVLDEAKISPRQLKICELKFIKGMANFQIAWELNVSQKTVERDINLAYKAVTRILSNF